MTIPDNDMMWYNNRTKLNFIYNLHQHQYEKDAFNYKKIWRNIYEGDIKYTFPWFNPQTKYIYLYMKGMFWVDPCPIMCLIHAKSNSHHCIATVVKYWSMNQRWDNNINGVEGGNRSVDLKQVVWWPSLLTKWKSKLIVVYYWALL